MSQLDAAVQLKRESVKKSDARVVSSWLCSKSLRFKRLQLQVFGRKIFMEKKVCVFELCLVFIKKIY